MVSAIDVIIGCLVPVILALSYFIWEWHKDKMENKNKDNFKYNYAYDSLNYPKFNNCKLQDWVGMRFKNLTTNRIFVIENTSTIDGKETVFIRYEDDSTKSITNFDHLQKHCAYMNTAYKFLKIQEPVQTQNEIELNESFSIIKYIVDDIIWHPETLSLAGYSDEYFVSSKYPNIQFGKVEPSPPGWPTDNCIDIDGEPFAIKTESHYKEKLEFSNKMVYLIRLAYDDYIMKTSPHSKVVLSKLKGMVNLNDIKAKATCDRTKYNNDSNEYGSLEL